jgi:hypothetical protein
MSLWGPTKENKETLRILGDVALFNMK